LEEAIAADPSNPEAHHLMASFWLSKDNKEVRALLLQKIFLVSYCNLQKATEYLDKGISLWLPALKQTHEEHTEGQQGEEPSVEEPSVVSHLICLIHFSIVFSNTGGLIYYYYYT
jgi:hypothetical protein